MQDNNKFRWHDRLDNIAKVERFDIGKLVKAGLAELTHDGWGMYDIFGNAGIRNYFRRYSVIVGHGYANFAPRISIFFRYDERNNFGEITMTWQDYNRLYNAMFNRHPQKPIVNHQRHRYPVRELARKRI